MTESVDPRQLDEPITVVRPRGGAPSPPPARLVLADGQVVSLASPVVLGRDPSRAGFVAVRVDDPLASMSRNHATVVPLGTDLVEITDLGSTNGTGISFGGQEVALRPQEATHVTVPCTLSCGDYVAHVEAGDR